MVPPAPPAPPADLAVRGAQPNPFRDAIDLDFSLGSASHVDLVVYDILGRELKVVTRNEWLGAGPQRLSWDGRDAGGREMGAGVYFLKLRTEAASATRVVVRVK